MRRGFLNNNPAQRAAEAKAKAQTALAARHRHLLTRAEEPSEDLLTAASSADATAANAMSFVPPPAATEPETDAEPYSFSETHQLTPPASGGAADSNDWEEYPEKMPPATSAGTSHVEVVLQRFQRRRQTILTQMGQSTLPAGTPPSETGAEAAWQVYLEQLQRHAHDGGTVSFEEARAMGWGRSRFAPRDCAVSYTHLTLPTKRIV